MKKIDKKVLKLVEQVARNEVMKNSNSKFPFCNGIFYQPMRPQKKQKGA